MLVASCVIGLAVGGGVAGVETVYVAPMSHTDIGFTAPPRTVAENFARYGDMAIELARRDPDYVWNFEVFWQFEQWLERENQPGLPPRRGTAGHRGEAGQPGGQRTRLDTPATAPSPPAELGELLDLVRSGRFGIGAAYVNPHTSLMSAWALDQLFRIPVQWGREHGLTLDWAVINDVPGHPPDLPQALAANGIQYLALGVNQTLSKRLPGEVSNTPFWWEAPDGSRVLTWISAEAYLEAFKEYGVDPDAARLFNPEEFDHPDPLEVMRRGMKRLLEHCRDRDYPYDAVLLLHAFDNWNPNPSGRLPAAVRLWNESGGRPRLVLATPGDFFRHIEARYGEQLPVRRGGFGGQWELVRMGAPSARARAEAREQELIRAGDQADLDEIRRLLVYWEHTYSLSTPWPGHLTRAEAIDQNRQQWQMVADWPLPEVAWPVGEEISLLSLPDSQLGEDASFQPNTLYLADSTFITWHGFRPMPQEAWPNRFTQRPEDGVLHCRHRIDRHKLPNPARVIWSWRLDDADADAPVIIRTAAGTMTWPDDGLAGYAPFHWIAPRGFRIGSTWFEPHGPFAFARPAEHPGWLLAYVLSQGLSARFRDGERADLTFEEVYQGEERIYEFAIDIRREDAPPNLPEH